MAGGFSEVGELSIKYKKKICTIYSKGLLKTIIIITDIFMDNCGRAIATETRFAFVLFCSTDDA